MDILWRFRVKEFHIINVGASIITNYQKQKSILKEVKLSDNEFWIRILDNSEFMNDIYQFVNKDPKINSAELNAFFRKIENSKASIEVYFSGTKTPVNEICVRTLERYMKESGFSIYTPKEFHGYFLETYNGEDREKEFVKGISDMLDHLIRLAQRKKEEGYKVFFNPTGGFKAHVIACSLAGFMTQCEVYYLNEEFQDLITFPPLFYIPKGKELELLNILSDNKPRASSDSDFKRLIDNFNDEIQRLEFYGLIECEYDEFGKPYRIKIKKVGEFILSEIIKLKG
jgi:putative CRISPR-associated protein (TIGR02619 family)